jgi:acyl-CoA thioester hydrolase
VSRSSCDARAPFLRAADPDFSQEIALTERARPDARSGYRHFLPIQTRWADNDAYGHVNNVVYYSWFDTIVNEYLIAAGALDIERSPVIGLVVETRCSYFSELAFPQRVEAGLRVAHIGGASVRYEIGLFAAAADSASAQGHFIHVYVDRTSRKPVPLPAALRAALERIQA